MANTTIKITQLNNIGGNLSANTLLPVVDTTGTAVTDKVTVGNVANFILTEAGNILPEAFVSQIAYSVANASQPNITSLGNLSGLTITNIDNFHVDGGVNGYVLQTNGNGNLSWVAQTGSGNGNPGGSNAQIQFNDSGLFNGVTAFTFDKETDTLNTVNIATSDITVYGNTNTINVQATGNVNANNFNAVNILYANNNIVVGSTGGEGGQITLGYAGINNMPGQANSTWNMDVDGSNNFRLFYQNASGSTGTILTANASSNIATFATVVKTTPVTFAELPSASTAGAGARAFITDANTTTFGAQVGGGGVTYMPVFSNGTNWFVG